MLQVWLIWLATGLGAMAVMAGLMREFNREASVLAQRLQWHAVVESTGLSRALVWMPQAHMLAALAILPIATGRLHLKGRYLGLLLISLAYCLVWWADLPGAWAVSDAVESWMFLQRMFVAMVSMGVGYPLLASVLSRRTDWERPLANLGRVAFALGCMCGGALLAGQLYDPWRAAALNADIATKGLTLIAWTACTVRLLQFAITPLRCEQWVTDQQRKGAVFAGELCLACGVAAGYFHFPALFDGLVLQWWPMIALGIALLSGGLGEYLRRRRQPIVADPVHQTSLLLPVIALAGVWGFEPTSVGAQWYAWENYAWVLATAAVHFGLQSWWRDSLAIRTCSAALALGAFWAMLAGQTSQNLFQHPQLWLLLPAVASLIFVELHRNRLNKPVVLATRYLAILVGYLSSTAE